MTYRTAITSLLCATFFQSLASAQDAQVINSKSGIDLNYVGVRGRDFAEEYYFHDPILWDKKVVYIRAETPITLTHNARNVAGNMHSSSVNQVKVGINGTDGVADSGDEGTIRFKVDGDLHFGTYWSNATPLYPAYKAPLSFATLTYPVGGAVLGTTGADPDFPVTDKSNYYHRGLKDSYGDEWHVLAYADDDKSWISTQAGLTAEFYASDGKSTLFVVNPRTPCLTLTPTTTSAQFYTTPPKAYYVPVIHEQTTYVTNDVRIDIVDILGGNSFWRIQGNNTWNPAGTSGISSNDLPAGAFTLEYKTDRTDVIKRRAMVRNPTHPSLRETHGNSLWANEAEFTAIKARYQASGTNLNTYYTNIKTKSANNKQGAIESKYRKSLREGMPGLLENAFLARALGTTAKMTGATRTYAEYAKMALLENDRNLDQLGHEISHTGKAIPTRELHYRGYYDVDPVFSLAFGYDLLVSFYRSDQVAGGITPIEDYFVRDILAAFVHEALQWGGNWNEVTRGGMWDTARRVGALVVAGIMPTYNTKYYGVSGFDGTATGWPWTPYPDQTHTWKQILFDNNTSRPGYPNQAHPLGIDEYNVTADGLWIDRPSYFDYQLMGHVLMIASNYFAINYTKSWPGFEAACLNAVRGQLNSVKFPNEGPLRFSCLLMMNNRFPAIKAAGMPYLKLWPSDHQQSESKCVARAGIFALTWYDPTVSSLTKPSSAALSVQINTK